MDNTFTLTPGPGSNTSFPELDALKDRLSVVERTITEMRSTQHVNMDLIVEHKQDTAKSFASLEDKLSNILYAFNVMRAGVTVGEVVWAFSVRIAKGVMVLAGAASIVWTLYHAFKTGEIPAIKL